jgi:16S rRNA (uracil1498-N3)-methyltransferase
VTAPVFVVETGQLAPVGAVVRLGGAEGRHAVAVRRLAAGEPVVLTDGLGAGVGGTVVGVVGKDVLEVEVAGVLAEPEPEPRLVVVQALPKGDRGELAVELMTEVGVDAVLPWSAERSITRWQGDRGERALAKWRSTAREAAKQSRRAWLPEIAAPVSTAALAKRVSGAAFAIVLEADATLKLRQFELPDAGDIMLIVGPEGGISPAERAALRAAGATEGRLGPTVLRTSTAGAVGAATLLTRTNRW